MNYRSIADLSGAIRTNLHRLPDGIDLIVGIPRSGMLPANIMALHMNRKLTDISGYLADIRLSHGRSRKSMFPDVLRPSDARHVLIVDDSIQSGISLEQVRALVLERGWKHKVTYCAIYASGQALSQVDVFFEVVEQPRVFEWNVMHRSFLSNCCLDIDGVLCIDPTKEENDDGERYRSFLLNATPMMIPSYKIGHLVTSRLEKYRPETEQWLARQGIIYDSLHMLDLQDAQTRRRMGCHASFKAGVFRSLKDTGLFIESEDSQAVEIARYSGKPVLSYSVQRMYDPGVTYAFVEKKAFTLAHRVFRKLRQLLKLLS